MKKKIAAAVLGILMAGTTAVYASPVTDFEKGHISAEFGSTLNSTFNGSGEVTGKADGKSGFKYGVTAGLGDNWALQFKGGKFKSEVFSGSSQTYPITVTTFGKATHQEFNLIRRISPMYRLSLAGCKMSFLTDNMWNRRQSPPFTLASWLIRR